MPRHWVQEHETAASRLDRLLADAKLISHLQWSSFQGAEYDRFAEELARYGVAVLTSWMYTGLIFERVKAKGFGTLAPLPESGWDPHDREGLAHLTVAVALQKFRAHVLIPGKWDHTKGATLKTYFIGQCLIRFPNHYRSWHAETTEHERHRADEIDPDRVVDRADVERQVVQRDELDRLLPQFPERTRQVLILLAEGYPQDEIAPGSASASRP